MANPKDVPILTKEAAALLNPSLPDAGFTRDEELARRQDTLQEALETATPDAQKIDLEAIEIQREIAYHITRNSLEVTGEQQGKRYAWVFSGQQGSQVMAKRAEGWEVVLGTDPEALELKAVDGTRRLGDVLLMRIDERRAIVLEAVDRHRRIRQQQATMGNLQELADKTKGGVIFHGEDSKMAQVAARRAAMQQQAFAGVDRMIREGTVPGLPQFASR